MVDLTEVRLVVSFFFMGLCTGKLSKHDRTRHVLSLVPDCYACSRFFGPLRVHPN